MNPQPRSLARPSKASPLRFALLAGLACAGLTLGGHAALSQTSTATPVRPPDASGAQTAVPAPRANGNADTPGGSARNGIIQPPSMTGSTPVITPRTQGAMPVIPPTGTPGSNSGVIAK